MRINHATLKISYLAVLVLSGCSKPCNGRVESTVLYFQEAPNHHGQVVYVNIENMHTLGVNQTLTREDKEFGTFGNVVIIEDPEMKFKGQRNICFDEFTIHKAPTEGDMREQNIPRLTIDK
jgi:hypothetical protein